VVTNIRSRVPPADPGLVRRKSLIGVRAACEQLWGKEGSEAVARALPQDVRERTAGIVPLAEWLPLGDLIAWHHVVWDGPARNDWKLMSHFARVTIDQGFGRVYRMMIGALTPQLLAPRVAKLWRDEYTAGKLEALTIEANQVKLRLSEHAYVGLPLMCDVISEAYRHVLSMARARNVRVANEARGGALFVTLRWD
jgi:hypothetical protein